MVSLIKYGALSGGEKYNTNILAIDGLSTDTKPITTFIEYGVDGREIGRTNIENGSTFTEIDTGKLFMYDAENTVWCEIKSGEEGNISKEMDLIKNLLATLFNDTPKNLLSATLDLDYLKSINKSGTWNNNVYTWRDVSATINENGTIIINGTPTQQFTFFIYTKARLATDISAGNYVLSGCPSGGGEEGANYRLFAWNPSETVKGATDIGLGIETYCDYTHTKDANIAIIVGANRQADNLLFKPMLCDAKIWQISPDYIQHIPSNQSLYNMIANI